MSFNDASFGRSSTFGQKCKRIPPKVPEDRDKKRLRYMREDNSTETTSTSDFKRPQVCSPIDGLRVSTSSNDKKFGSHREMILPEACGSK